jgi:3-oxoadipate CoA-transferase beta subunit
VAVNGDLANWSTGAPGAIPAVGGAMDLVAGVRRILVVTEHTTRDGEPKLVERCSFPLTGEHVVSRIYTNLAVIDVADNAFHLREIAPGVDVETIRSSTMGDLVIDPDLAVIASE